RPALRGAARGIRSDPHRPAPRPGTLAAGHVRTVVPDQAARDAAAVPASRRAPAGEGRAVRGTDGPPRGIGLAHERQRPAAVQSAVALRADAGCAAAGAAGGAGAGGRLASPAVA